MTLTSGRRRLAGKSLLVLVLPLLSDCRGADGTSLPSIQPILKQARAAETREQHRAATKTALEAAETAIGANEFALAIQFLNVAAGSASHSDSPWMQRQVSVRRDEAAAMSKEFRKIGRDVKTLEMNASDGKARVAVGRFQSLVKGEWKEGLQNLAKGADPALANLASLDLNAGEPGKGSLEVAQAWATQAEKESSTPSRKAMQWRAYLWAQEPYKSGLSDNDRPIAEEIMSASPKRYLSDMNEHEVKNGAHPFAKYGDAGVGKRIQVDGMLSPYGIGLHPPNKGYAAVSYLLNGKYTTFVSGYGINKPPDKAQVPVTFAVFGDGKLLWRSPPITAVDHIDVCQVNFKGVRILELRTEARDTAYGAHCCWIEPYIAR